MDTRQPGTFLVAADGVDLFAELGAGGKIDEHRRKGQQHQPHQGQGGKLAVAEAVEGLVSGQPGIHLVHRGPAPDEIFRQVLGQGAIDEHGGQGHDEGGHFHNAHQHPVHSPQQRPGCQGKKQGEQDAAGGVEHHHRKSRIHGQDGPYRKVDLPRKADQPHTQSQYPDNGRMTEDVHDAAPGQAAAGERPDQKDRDENQNIAVLPRQPGQRAFGGCFHTDVSSLAQDAPVDQSITVFSLISSWGSIRTSRPS